MNTIKIIATISVFLFISYGAKACTCIGESTVKNEIRAKDAVFVGIIAESEEIRIYDTLNSSSVIYRVEMKYTILVEATYKGRQVSDTAYIFTGRGGGDCGFDFQIGQKYIVYARHLTPADRVNELVFIDKKRAFRTNICTRTRKYDEQEIVEIEQYLKKRK
jgi:hypothetical protein